MFGNFFRNIFLVFCLIGLIYTASCVNSCVRYFSPAEPVRHERRLKHDADNVPPMTQIDPDFDFGQSGNRQSETYALPTPVPRGEWSNPPSLETQSFAVGEEDDDTGSDELYFSDDYRPPIDPAVAVLCAPGLYALGAVGFTPESPLLWAFVILTSFVIYGAALRLSFVGLARWCGVGYSPRAYRYWLWFTSLPWAPLYRLLEPVIHWRRLLRMGRSDSDRWAGFFERAIHVFKPGQLLLGRQTFWYLPCLAPLGLSTERGCTVVASPGSGKSSWLACVLSLWPGGFAVVDPDGGIYRSIADHLRRQGKRLLAFDPFGLSGEPSACLNALNFVLEAIRLYGMDAAVEFAAVLAQGAIRETHGQNEWIAQDARAFLKSLILYVCLYAKPEQRNMVYVRRLLVLGDPDKARPTDDKFQVLLADMVLKGDVLGGAIASGAEIIRRSQSKTDGRCVPLSYCIEQTQGYDLPALARISTHSDFEYLDLKKETDVCVFLIMPLQAMTGPLAASVRMFFTQIIYAFQRDVRHRAKHPMLLCLEECAHVNLDRKLTALLLAGMRRFGMASISIFQSVAQMGDAASDYLGLSEANIFMATNDEAGLSYLSDTLGQISRTQRVPGNWPFDIAPHHQREDRKLASPGQLKLLLRNRVVVVRTGAAPMLLAPMRHYVELPLRWLSRDPYYGDGSRARAFTRRLLSFFTGRQTRRPARLSTNRRKEISQ